MARTRIYTASAKPLPARKIPPGCVQIPILLSIDSSWFNHQPTTQRIEIGPRPDLTAQVDNMQEVNP